MRYLELYNLCKAKTNYHEDRIRLTPGLEIRNFDFQSRIRFQLPAMEALLDEEFEAGMEARGLVGARGLRLQINKSDAEIEENLRFRYHLMLPEGRERADNVVLMFHGFNEKYWDKYLPWAARIVSSTGKAVLMFPIAFHMNRAPALWSEPRPMHRVSQERRKRYPNLVSSSLSNVAISTRLHNRPERFIWSGLESYHDVIDLVERIKAGEHPAIAADAGIDFCSYSIGTFLGEILMMSNKRGYFSDSRYATFCGGPVFNRLSPVSKFILDSEANVALYSYLVEHLESHMKRNEALRLLLSGDYEEGLNFRSLLNYRVDKQYREDKFRSFAGRFYAVALARDEVVPSYEVTATLRGSAQDIPIAVDVLDYPYPYKHEDPFPPLEKIADAVDREFSKTFGLICDFLA